MKIFIAGMLEQVDIAAVDEPPRRTRPVISVSFDRSHFSAQTIDAARRRAQGGGGRREQASADEGPQQQ